MSCNRKFKISFKILMLRYFMYFNKIENYNLKGKKFKNK
jgi:hypothetical protein